jgi:urate oxidase
MPVRIAQNSYGKSRVRLIKVARSGSRHEIQNLTINIAFEGDFDAVHSEGDNALCLPTDTMKNTVYALAGEEREIEQPEALGRRLAEHFLNNNAHVSAVRLQLKETGWERMRFDDKEHPHSFLRNSDEKRTVEITATRMLMTVEAGIEDLVVLKSSGSGFAGFKKDEFTTLPECTDRILSTSVKAVWRYSAPEVASFELFQSIRKSILRTFSEHDSRSVQHTLYAMGEEILERFSDVEEVRFSLPNIHCLPVDISRFGIENQNCIFVPTDEPHGLIEATISRQ